MWGIIQVSKKQKLFLCILILIGKVINPQIFIEGKILSDFKSEFERKGDVEEYRTVGIGNSTKENAKNISVYGDYNKAEDITENGLRKEHGLPLRMRYVADE